jgi:hypothetical protein
VENSTRDATVTKRPSCSPPGVGCKSTYAQELSRNGPPE